MGLIGRNYRNLIVAGGLLQKGLCDEHTDGREVLRAMRELYEGRGKYQASFTGPFPYPVDYFPEYQVLIGKVLQPEPVYLAVSHHELLGRDTKVGAIGIGWNTVEVAMDFVRSIGLEWDLLQPAEVIEEFEELARRNEYCIAGIREEREIRSLFLEALRNAK